MFNLDSLVQEYENLETQLSDPEIFKDQKRVREVSSRKKQISEAVTLYKDYKLSQQALQEAVEMLYNEKDEDMRELAKMQKDESESQIADLEEKLKIALLPKDQDDDKNIMLEVRAGTGGEEAALFAGELAKAYMIYAQEQGFQIEIAEQTLAESG